MERVSNKLRWKYTKRLQSTQQKRWYGLASFKNLVCDSRIKQIELSLIDSRGKQAMLFSGNVLLIALVMGLSSGPSLTSAIFPKDRCRNVY